MEKHTSGAGFWARPEIRRRAGCRFLEPTQTCCRLVLCVEYCVGIPYPEIVRNRKFYFRFEKYFSRANLIVGELEKSSKVNVLDSMPTSGLVVPMFRICRMGSPPLRPLGPKIFFGTKTKFLISYNLGI